MSCIVFPNNLNVHSEIWFIVMSSQGSCYFLQHAACVTIVWLPIQDRPFILTANGCKELGESSRLSRGAGPTRLG